jgi:hypothetical protein
LASGRARRADQLLDALESQLAQRLHNVGLEPQRPDRQQPQRLAVVPRLDRNRSSRRDMARHGMGAAGCVRDRDLDGQAERGQPTVKVLHQRALVAEQCGAAGDVEPEAIGRVGGDDRCVTLPRP